MTLGVNLISTPATKTKPMFVDMFHSVMLSSIFTFATI